MIASLSENFPGRLIGYSDHTRPDPTMTCLRTAARLGARIIEKHFTLDKTLPGNDHYHAMDPDDLAAFRRMMQTGEPAVDARLEASLLGEREKRCVGAEAPARTNARRSIVTVRDVTRGEVITRDMVTFKRPGTGIPPSEIDGVLGRRATGNIAKDTIIQREMIAP
jgi:N-acetylneuraminate synthase